MMVSVLTELFNGFAKRSFYDVNFYFRPFIEEGEPKDGVAALDTAITAFLSKQSLLNSFKASLQVFYSGQNNKCM